MNLQNNIADEINRHAELATTSANKAMLHAVEAGKLLLLEVKASMAHGQFGAWLETNVKVSPRQAQRYMAVAEGKPVPVRSLSSKYDTVSHLTGGPTKYEEPRPLFIPETGLAYSLVLDNKGYYIVEPSSDHPGFYFVGHCAGGKSDEIVYLRKPIKANWVETIRQGYGLAEPALADWGFMPTDGVSFAMESVGIPPPERGW